jgi:hypothetical protein
MVGEQASSHGIPMAVLRYDGWRPLRRLNFAASGYDARMRATQALRTYD